MKSKKKLIALVSSLSLVVVAAVIAVVAVLVATNRTAGNTISVSYIVTDVNAGIELKYAKGSSNVATYSYATTGDDSYQVTYSVTGEGQVTYYVDGSSLYNDELTHDETTIKANPTPVVDMSNPENSNNPVSGYHIVVGDSVYFGDKYLVENVGDVNTPQYVVAIAYGDGPMLYVVDDAGEYKLQDPENDTEFLDDVNGQSYVIIDDGTVPQYVIIVNETVEIVNDTVSLSESTTVENTYYIKESAADDTNLYNESTCETVASIPGTFYIVNRTQHWVRFVEYARYEVNDQTGAIVTSATTNERRFYPKETKTEDFNVNTLLNSGNDIQISTDYDFLVLEYKVKNYSEDVGIDIALRFNSIDETLKVNYAFSANSLLSFDGNGIASIASANILNGTVGQEFVSISGNPDIAEAVDNSTPSEAYVYVIISPASYETRFEGVSLSMDLKLDRYVAD